MDSFAKGLCYIFVVWFLPLVASYRIAEDRNRNKAKAVVVTIPTGWTGTLLLWLALKTRKKGRLV